MWNGRPFSDFFNVPTKISPVLARTLLIGISNNPSHAVFGQRLPRKITGKVCLWGLFNTQQRKTDTAKVNLGPYSLG